MVHDCGGDMRPQYLVFVLTWIIANAASCRAQSVPTSDTVLRAAYCIGVLDEEISRSKSLPRTDQCAVLAEDNQCWATEKDMAQAFDEVQQHHEKTRKRYAQYLFTQMPNLEHMRTRIMAIIAKGKADHRQAYASDAFLSEATKCAKSCADNRPPTSTCSIECIAQHDQVHANIWKCIAHPDQLPF
jgi:hypothetical protein